MIKLKQLLLEKTFNISTDVEYIYKYGGFEKFLKEFKENKHYFPHHQEILRGKNVVFEILKSEYLKSLDAVKANLANSVTIYCGIMREGAFYMPEKRVIYVSLHYGVLNIFAKREENNVSSNLAQSFSNEITEHRIKSTISHELSHWISDSLYNNHLGKLLRTASELKNTDFIKLNKEDVNMAYFEIDAQIHGIKELKRKFKLNWDKLTIIDVFNKYVSLNSIARNIYDNYGQDILNIWQKSLLKRMARENLLGKNMNHFVKGSEL